MTTSHVGFDALLVTRLSSGNCYSTPMKSVPLAEVSYAAFAELLHSRFRVHRNSSTQVELELMEATAHPSAPKTDQDQVGTFSLVFTGPLDQFLTQRTYRFEHEKLGAFDLFIVPIAKDQNSFHYEAVFNRPAQSGTSKPYA